MMDLSIVVVSFNTLDITRRCLRSIREQTQELAYEIIVVDNHSTDGSTGMIEREFPEVRLIRNDENLGFARAQNIGLSQALGRCFLILNSDCLFVGNAAKRLFGHLTNCTAQVGVLGPQILNPDGSIAPSARRTIMPKPMVALGVLNRYFHFKRLLPPERLLRACLGFLLKHWHDNYSPHDKIREAEYVDGMAVMVRREVLERVGLFDEQIFFGTEILDLCNRIRADGWKIQFFPGAQIIHLGHASRNKLRRIVIAIQHGELVYYAKYSHDRLPVIRVTCIAAVTILSLLLRAKTGLVGAKEDDMQTLAIYSEILKNCREFDPASAWANERIPRIQAFPR